MRLGIVASKFNQEIASELLQRAQAAARELGVETSVVTAPRARETALALEWIAQSRRLDARPALRADLRRDTSHREAVDSEAARGVMDVSLDFGLPVANGILTTEDEPQALARLDKGAEAVRVAVEMARLKERMHEDR